MPDAPRSLAAVKKEIQARGVEFLFAQFVEMYGKPNAKLVPANHVDDLFAEGAGFAGFAAGEIGQGPHSPDLAAMPDPASFTVLPWQPNVARFASDVFVEGEPWPYCPRTILRNQMERARGKGYIFKIGMEVEFFLLKRGDDGRISVADDLDTLERPCYDMRGALPAVRFHLDAVEVRERAGVGQLRERPRGRERAVRIELPVRGRGHARPIASSSSGTWSIRWRSATGCSPRSCRSHSPTSPATACTVT